GPGGRRRVAAGRRRGAPRWRVARPVGRARRRPWRPRRPPRLGLTGGRTGVARRQGGFAVSTVVSGIFRDSTAVQDALARLERDGMTRDKVSVLGSPETQGKKLVIVERTKAPEGAVAGAVVGGALGIVVGVLLAWFG